jgi:hypothetical protein
MTPAGQKTHLAVPHIYEFWARYLERGAPIGHRLLVDHLRTCPLYSTFAFPLSICHRATDGRDVISGNFIHWLQRFETAVFR